MEPPSVRDSIVREASSLFANKGYSGLSMRELAESVGVSKAALYYYFPDKEQLFVGILLDYLAEMQERLVQILGQEVDLQIQLSQVIAYIHKQPESGKRMIWFLRNDIWQLSDQNVDKLLIQYHQGFVDTIKRMFQRAMERGEIRDFDLVTITWSFLGMVYPFVNAQRGYQTDEAHWPGEVLEIFLHGLSA